MLSVDMERKLHCIINILFFFLFSGQIIKFARACSTVSQDSKNTKGCLPINKNNVTVCYDICFTDGCNLATKTSISIAVLAIVAMVLCFVLWCRISHLCSFAYKTKMNKLVETKKHKLHGSPIAIDL